MWHKRRINQRIDGLHTAVPDLTYAARSQDGINHRVAFARHGFECVLRIWTTIHITRWELDHLTRLAINEQH